MNANIQGMLDYYKHKKINNIIVTEQGKYLSDKEARVFLMWGIENGYKDLYSMPEFESVADKLKL